MTETKKLNKPKVQYISAICKICGTSYEYYIEKNGGCTKIACSGSCAQKVRRNKTGYTPKIKLRCALQGCENIRTVLPCLVVKKSKFQLIYCSRKCCTFARRNLLKDFDKMNKFYHMHNWIIQRRKALERDKYICQRCGKTSVANSSELSVHHIIPVRFFNLDLETFEGKILVKTVINDLNNLISLCYKCHGSVEITGIDFKIPVRADLSVKSNLVSSALLDPYLISSKNFIFPRQSISYQTI